MCVRSLPSLACIACLLLPCPDVMLHHSKQPRKRHLSIDSVITLLNPLGSCRRAISADVIASQRIVAKKDEETEMGSGDMLSQAGVTRMSDEECILRPHLMEPREIDHPLRCPHPEHGILQDGRALKSRAPSIKRRGSLPFLTNEETQSKRWSTMPSVCEIYPAASAPEISLKTILP